MTRRARIGLGAAVVALAFGIVFVRLDRPLQRPELAVGERGAIDVSSHQGTIDWPAVARDGTRVAYIKATEGADFVDDAFARNWEGAHLAGIEHGAYHFFTLCRPGLDQAENFLRTVPRDSNALAPVVDLELTGNCAARPSRDDVLHELALFIDRVEADRKTTIMLYVLDDIEAKYFLRHAIERPLWLRSRHRPIDSAWKLWQVDFESTVTGIDGGVDFDIVRAPTAPPH